MIISHSKKFVCLNPPKTGSGYREILFKTVSDISIINSKIRRHLDIPDTIKFAATNGLDISDYYKFTFVRNPWDRYVSWFNMSVQLNPKKFSLNKENFKEFISGIIYRTQTEYITYAQNPNFMDFIGCFETFETDLNFVLKKLNLKLNTNIPIASNLKHDFKKQINEYWDNNLIESVRKHERPVIELKNYEFNEILT